MAHAQAYAVAVQDMPRQQFAAPARLWIAAGAGPGIQLECQLPRRWRRQTRRPTAVRTIAQAVGAQQIVGVNPALDAARIVAEPARDLIATTANTHQQHRMQPMRATQLDRPARAALELAA